MLDSRASHNLMPIIIMDNLGLEIKRSHHDMYYFDSKRLKCIGMIKDLVVTLAQLLMKSIMMDVVMVDIPVNFGMLLSKSWAGKLRGTIHMDMTYATIPVFGGEHIRLYK